MANIVTVRIKSEDTTLKKDFLVYEIFALDHDDPVLNRLINETKAEYKGELIEPDIRVTSKMEW